MHLVDDKDPVFSGGRRVLHLLLDISDVVDAVIRCRIDLLHVHGALREYGPAGCADTAGVAPLRLLAVHGARHNLCDTRLTRAPGPAEEIGVSHTPALNLVAERRADGILPLYLIEVLGPPLAIECDIRHLSGLRTRGPGAAPLRQSKNSDPPPLTCRPTPRAECS